MRATVTMPFGKFRGTCLRDLPGDYLLWLRGLELREPLRTHVAREHARRRHARASSAPQPQLSPAQRAVAVQIVTAGFRTLARERHPDHGGAHDDMLVLIAARDALASLLRRTA
jgi:hypothetical protein